MSANDAFRENSADENLKTAEKDNKSSSLARRLLPNRALFPLKLAMFFYGASAFSILPYLTIHMKDIGISVEHIAVIYAILPFITLFSLPVVGYMADMLGSYTRVIMLMLVSFKYFADSV